MPTSTWTNLPEAKRQRVLAAAVDEFGKHGFSGGSLNVVAREADIAKGSLFQYFDDKLDLYAHVCEVVSQRVRDRMLVVLETHAATASDLFDLLRAALVDWVRYFRDHPDDRGVTFAANFELDPEARHAVRSVTNRHYVEVLGGLLDGAAQRGELRPDASRDHLLAVLVVLLPHLALAGSTPELDPVLGLHALDGPDLADRVARFVDGLERGYGAGRAPGGG